jgi:outer membrane protein assembly factor BamB
VLLISLVALLLSSGLYQTANAQLSETENQTNYEWPMFHHDAAFTGYTDSKAPNSPNMLWNYSLSSGVMCASPAVVDGRLFIQSEDDWISCLNSSIGTVLWQFRSDLAMECTQGHYHPNRASAAVVNGRVYMGSIDNYLYCLNETTGLVIWKYQAGDDLFSFIAVADGKVFTGSANFNIYCLDADSGALIWKYYTGDWPFNPAVSGGKVFAGSKDRFFALDADTGTMLWTYTASSKISDSPCVADGKVFFADGGSPQGWVGSQIHCLDAETGTILWSCDAPPAIFSSPAFAYGKIFIGSWNGNVYCINPKDGAIIWNYQTDNSVASSPAVSDGKLYIGSNDGFIYCLNATTGMKIWKYELGSEVKSSPAIADGKLYAVSREGIVYCFGGSNAKPSSQPILGPSSEFYTTMALTLVAISFACVYLFVRIRKGKKSI